MAIWPFGIFYGPFGNLVVICCIFLRFGILHQKKSGNPGVVRGQGVSRHFSGRIFFSKTKIHIFSRIFFSRQEESFFSGGISEVIISKVINLHEF
jgi:hypothetical protein